MKRHEWERLGPGGSTYRMKVPGGWVYQSISGGRPALCFVPTPPPAPEATKPRPAALPKTEIRADILDSMRTLGPCTIYDLIDDTGRTHKSLEYHIRLLRDAGKIERAGTVPSPAGPSRAVWVIV